MKLRSVIIDDEEMGIETLRLLIEKHVEEVKVVGEATRAREGIELIENYRPEIVFLDIRMPEMDGFELLEKLSWKNFKLIFTTAHQEHALKAIKLSAVDYLLKPIDPVDLQLAVGRIKAQRLSEQETASRVDFALLNSVSHYPANKLAITSKSGVENIDLPEIIIFESKSNYAVVYLADGRTILTPKTLRDFDHALCHPGSGFMRVHHSYIINLHNVLRYIKENDHIVMMNGLKIPLAKSRRDGFFNWLGI